MVPVAYDSTDGNYYGWVGDNNDVSTDAATKNSHYIEFALYFKSGSTDNLSVTVTDFNFQETTPTLPSKMVLSPDGLSQGTAGTTYTCNFFRALTYVQTIGTSTEVASGSTAAMSGTGTRTAYDIEALKTNSDSLTASSNAHKYYNSVKGLYELTTDTALDATKIYYTFNSATGQYTAVASPAVGDIASYYECTGIDMTKENSEELTTATVTGTGENITNSFEGVTLGQTGAGSLSGMSPILMVKYTIYLDGWDQFCFDACQGQSFSLSMEFTGTRYTG